MRTARVKAKAWRQDASLDSVPGIRA